MLQADPKGILVVVAVLFCWALAVLLLRVSNKGSVARKLSLLLVFEGLTLGTSNAGVQILAAPAELFANNPGLHTFQHLAHTLGDVGMLMFYPTFLASALQTPLARPFAISKFRNAWWVICAAVYVFVAYEMNPVSLTVLYVMMASLFVYAFLAAVHSWYLAKGMARTRAKIFVLAFGIRDICWNIIYVTAIWGVWFDPIFLERLDNQPGFYILYTLGTLIAVPLIAYGILRTQLFDIDLKIQWTIKQSTLAGIFVAVMYLISEGASEFLSAELGNVTGLLAAAVLMFFLAPLQRFAERVSSAAMPNTKNTPEYVSFRKFQVYESAVSEALLEGGISTKERKLLNHLRESLGLSESDADAIEDSLKEGDVSYA
jgi:hypothetical protein